MSATLTRTRCTLREFLEIIDDMERSGTYQWMELIGGALVVNSSPSNPHMKAEMPIFALLWAAEEAGYGQAGADRVVALDYPERGMEAEDVFKPVAFFVSLNGWNSSMPAKMGRTVSSARPTSSWRCSPPPPPNATFPAARSSTPMRGPAFSTTGCSTRTPAPSGSTRSARDSSFRWRS